MTAVADGPKVGDEFPDFSLVGSDGKTYSAADLKGKQAFVIAWYPKAFTPGCTNECKSFRDEQAALTAFDVSYFTASCDTAEKNKEFAESLKLNYPILSDSDGKLAGQLGIYDATRKVAKRVTFVVGKDGKILAIDTAVNTGNHGKDIAKKLDEVKVGKK